MDLQDILDTAADETARNMKKKEEAKKEDVEVEVPGDQKEFLEFFNRVEGVIEQLAQGGEGDKKPVEKLGEDLENIMKQKEGGEDMEMLQKMLGALMEEGEGEEGEMGGFLNTLMEQLMQKNVLYEPMKHMLDVYPKYLAEAEIPEEARKNYEKQLACISEICTLFEDEGDEHMEAIVAKMNEMQGYGPPPDAVLDQISPPGESEDGMEDMMANLTQLVGKDAPDGCCIQ